MDGWTELLLLLLLVLVLRFDLRLRLLRRRRERRLVTRENDGDNSIAAIIGRSPGSSHRPTVRRTQAVHGG